MTAFSVGEPVEVTDPGHLALLEFLRVANRREPDPIHHGVVGEIRSDGYIVIVFDDDGTSAPYPAEHVRRRRS